MIAMEISVGRPQLERATAKASLGTQEYLEFLQIQLRVEERERAMAAIDAGQARIISPENLGQPVFGPGNPYVSWMVPSEKGQVVVAVPIRSDITIMHNTIQETISSLVDEVVDRHNRLSDQERNAMKVAYTTGTPWLIKQPLLMQLQDKFEYVPDSNLLRRREAR